MLEHEVRENLIHEAIQRAACARNQVEDGVAFRVLLKRTLDTRKLAGNPAYPRNKFLLCRSCVTHGIGG